MNVNTQPSPSPHIDRRTPVAQLPEWLTVNETAQYLEISLSSAYVFAREHGIRVGKLLRVPKAAVVRG